MMPLGCCFPFPCECCKKDCLELPTEAMYTEYLSVLQQEDPTIGINGVQWHSALYPNLYTHKDRLVYRFNQKYGFREITNPDTSRWMFYLQNKFDEIANNFDHAYKLYDDKASELDELTLGHVRNIIYNNESAGSSSATGSSQANSKFRDTPTDGTSVINNPTTENQDNGSSSSTGSDSREGSGESTEKYDYHDDHLMMEVNKLIEKYKQLDESFINKFDEMFISILAKWC